MLKQNMFIFDLDGTLTQVETLPLIASKFNVTEQIKKLTLETVNGNIPFVESFIQRVAILGKLDVSKIALLLEDVLLFQNIVAFIQKYPENCVIATGNFQGWVEKLVAKIGCTYYASDAVVENDNIKKLTIILKKEDIVKRYQAQGYNVVMIGDGNNDMEAMREADISIASGLIHYPAQTILSISDYAVFEEKTLLRLLNQIQNQQSGTSLVLSCAGIGSRLGLDKTKALIEIDSKKLIHWQLEYFKKIEDLRVVVGYQANSVIKAVLEKRKDTLFVYNHDYFSTKTGTSFYLGSRDANEYVIAWDGDLIVDPKDIQKCLEYNGEYIGCSDIVTDDAVFVKVNENNEVVAFSTKQGDYEWSGPAKLKKDKIKYISTNVYNQIEEYLPLPMLKITAQDIDTYDDYKKAIQFIKEHYNG
jgi:HAD superfamily phosphoserine phosphatase-like hydrolase